MAKLKVYTVFLPVKHRKMLKLFNKVTDPSSRSYANYACYNYFDVRWEVAARNYFSKFKGAALRKTYFPGVLRLITTEEERLRNTVPIFYSLKEEEDFESIEQSLICLDKESSIYLLDGKYEASRKFKKRVNLALIDLALQGKTVLASSCSFFGELPALTSFTDGKPPNFSDHFKRKKYAKYQDFLVKNYIQDPLIATKLKSLEYPFKGRASPDISLSKPAEFIEKLQAINEKRELERKPALGFLNPILYKNANIFQRNVQKEKHGFPFSVTLWRPNIGLGEPITDRLESLF
jgi:hypothetical protein